MARHSIDIAREGPAARGTRSMHEHDIAVREFLAESYENLDQFERDLVAVEDDPRDRATLDRGQSRGPRIAPAPVFPPRRSPLADR
jgi:hypothetical protein